MVHMAIKVERQFKRKGTRSFQNTGEIKLQLGGKTKGLFSSPKSNHQKGEIKLLLSTKLKMNPKLVIMILSVFVVWK